MKQVSSSREMRRDFFWRLGLAYSAAAVLIFLGLSPSDVVVRGIVAKGKEPHTFDLISGPPAESGVVVRSLVLYGIPEEAMAAWVAHHAAVTGFLGHRGSTEYIFIHEVHKDDLVEGD